MQEFVTMNWGYFVLVGFVVFAILAVIWGYFPRARAVVIGVGVGVGLALIAILIAFRSREKMSTEEEQAAGDSIREDSLKHWDDITNNLHTTRLKADFEVEQARLKAHQDKEWFRVRMEGALEVQDSMARRKALTQVLQEMRDEA